MERKPRPYGFEDPSVTRAWLGSFGTVVGARRREAFLRGQQESLEYWRGSEVFQPMRGVGR